MRYVYFIVGRGYTKVGSSSSPALRLASANVWSPKPLRLVFQAEGGFALERAVWESLSARHVRGEWFSGEVSAEEAAALVEAVRTRSRESTGVSAKDMWPRPKCECHSETMWWAKDKNRRGGGYWRCSVKMKESASRSRASA